jgi:hypothetical protein
MHNEDNPKPGKPSKDKLGINKKRIKGTKFLDSQSPILFRNLVSLLAVPLASVAATGCEQAHPERKHKLKEL